MFIVFGGHCQPLLRTREISLHKNNSHDLHRVITHSLDLVILFRIMACFECDLHTLISGGDHVVLGLYQSYFITSIVRHKNKNRWVGDPMWRSCSLFCVVIFYIPTQNNSHDLHRGPPHSPILVIWPWWQSMIPPPPIFPLKWHNCLVVISLILCKYKFSLIPPSVWSSWDCMIVSLYIIMVLFKKNN